VHHLTDEMIGHMLFSGKDVVWFEDEVTRVRFVARARMELASLAKHRKSRKGKVLMASAEGLALPNRSLDLVSCNMVAADYSDPSRCWRR
jgi:hypothetical protein